MAFDAAGWTGLTFKALHLDFDWVLVTLSWAFTWLFYTHDRLNISESDQINNPKRSAWYAAAQRFLKPIMLGVSIGILGLVSMRLSILLPVLVGIIPCILYAKKLTIGRFSFTLKGLPGMKALLVAFLWVILTVIFPVICTKSPLPSNSVLLSFCLMVSCFIILQINTNDLRDIEGDKQEGVKSFAVLLGDKNARLLGLSFIVAGIFFGWQLFNPVSLILFGFLLALRTILYEKQNDIYWQFFISIQGVVAFILLT